MSKFRRLRGGAAIAVGVCAVATLVPPAVATHGGSYTILRSNGIFDRAGTHLWKDGVDDAVRTIRFPFAVKIYGHDRTSAAVSSNGNIQFGPSPSAKYNNGCLPDSGLSGPVIAVYYDDILIRPNDISGDGVMTKVYGTAPNRMFVIVWRGVEFSDPDEPVRAEIKFYEGRSYWDTVYAAGSGEWATVGVQNYYRTDWDQRTCNTGAPAIATNDQFRFSYTAP